MAFQVLQLEKGDLQEMERDPEKCGSGKNESTIRVVPFETDQFKTSKIKKLFDV